MYGAFATKALRIREALRKVYHGATENTENHGGRGAALFRVSRKEPSQLYELYCVCSEDAFTLFVIPCFDTGSCFLEHALWILPTL